MFNHESPRRGETFVTRKITRALSRIHCGLEDCLYIGNLNAKRDWGHAKDYVTMQWLMLQQNQPKDYVIATGQQYSVREFIQMSADRLGWGLLTWEGKDAHEIGYKADGRAVVRVDPRYFRPAEVETLLGDASKARHELNWSPSIGIKDLVSEMIDHDLKVIQMKNS